MRRFLALLFVLLLSSSLLGRQVKQIFISQVHQYPLETARNHTILQRNEVISYQETFENGNDGWTFMDGTVPSSQFHSYNSPADGWVWWMGDPALAENDNIGGYQNHEYLVLDTPLIQVPNSDAYLTFRLRCNVEPPAGATTPYNGWDACNIRISTDGGSTWSILNGTPAYNISSAYSFGYDHGEGTNIPGWGGNSSGWVNASFDLNSFAGQAVKIRFAFASDDAYDTTENAAMFGMMIDDISLGDFTNDGSTITGFNTSSLVPVGGQLWHIAGVADAPSPTHAMVCQNDSGTYNPNMLNYVVSPSIQLPQYGNIKADFMIKGSFSDLGNYPDVDTWGWDISPDNGVTWYPMWNPYNSPSMPNCIIIDVPATWSSATSVYTGFMDGWISDYAGLTVKFRIYFKTNATSEEGVGIMIDDFTITNVLPLPSPTNLIATPSVGNVILNWTAPLPAMTPPLTGYNVFHSLDPEGEFTQIAEISNPEIHNFVDGSPISGAVNYYRITAEYGEEQSEPSNMASIFVLGADYDELQNDDNEADQGYSVGAANSMAVRFHFDNPSNFGWELDYIRIYLDTVGTTPLIIRIYDANGTDSAPGTLLLQFTYPNTSLLHGWNIIPLPSSSHVLDNEGNFYVGIIELYNPSSIGIDTDSHNSSWKKMGISLPWEQISEGNLMIRAIVRNPVSNDDPTGTPSLIELSSNYPNPFNPSTTIEFGVPKAADVSLKIFNTRGQLVKVLANKRYEPGTYKIVWNGEDDDGSAVASGVYFYRLEVAGKCFTHKMLMLK